MRRIVVMERKPYLSRRAPIVAVLLLCAVGWSSNSRSAHWSDRLPADDPSLVPQRQEAVAPATAGPPPASAADAGYGYAPPSGGGSVFGRAYDRAAEALWSAVGAVESVSAATREALWETAYMLGINRTPARRSSVNDDFADIQSSDIVPAPTESPALPRAAHRPEAGAAQLVASAALDGQFASDALPGPLAQPASADAIAVPAMARPPEAVRVEASAAPDGTIATDAPPPTLAEAAPMDASAPSDGSILFELAPAPSEPAAVPPPALTHQLEAAPARVEASAASNPPVTTDAPPAPLFPPVARDVQPEHAQLSTIDPGLLANFVYDRGVRRADGSFFVPKPLQRLFEVRTQRVASAEVPVTVSLAGRIVADPQNRGNVEASLMGRIEPPEGGLPVLGQMVHKGDILAYVAPAVGVVDRTQVRSEVARLTTEIRVDTENLETLKQFSFVPFRDGKIYQSEQLIAGLRRQRDALLPLLDTREVLRASVDGVVSTSSAIAGRVVHPGEAVFTIVNPSLLWIEALAPDPAVAENAERVQRATATTPEGQNLTLTFVGSGLAQKEQSTPVLFRIDNPPPGLRVGRPVTVAVQSENRTELGLPISRDALTIGTDGVQEVWEQTEAEVFVPRVVRTIDLDGRSVLIVNGLNEGARVVVAGVRLLAQLQ
jgi:hypothetical protein